MLLYWCLVVVDIYLNSVEMVSVRGDAETFGHLLASEEPVVPLLLPGVVVGIKVYVKNVLHLKQNNLHVKTTHLTDIVNTGH